MDKEDIIRMAREAQLGTSLIHKGGEQRVWIEGADWHDELERFAALAFAAGAAAEREACAKACEAIERNGAWVTKQEAAAAIRARGEQ
jgi:hypothetical protein